MICDAWIIKYSTVVVCSINIAYQIQIHTTGDGLIERFSSCTSNKYRINEFKVL
jgi:hypothetical protein